MSEMATSNESDSAGKAGGLRKFSSTIAAVLVLSLATWLFFYLKSMPLGLPETTVIVGFWLAVALVVKWIAGCIWKKSSTGRIAND